MRGRSPFALEDSKCPSWPRYEKSRKFDVRHDGRSREIADHMATLKANEFFPNEANLANLVAKTGP